MSQALEDNLSGYADSLEYLADEMKWLDLIIRLQVMAEQPDEAPQSTEADSLEWLKGMAVSEQEVYRLLGGDGSPHQNTLEYAEIQRELLALEDTIAERVQRSHERGTFLSLSYLSHVFQLTNFERKCLLLALAGELHRKYERIFVFLQDDLNRKYPTVELAIRLFARTDKERLASRDFFSSQGRLFTYFFVREENNASQTLISKPLKLEERIISFLLDHAGAEEHMDRVVKVMDPEESLPSLLWEKDVQERIRTFFDQHLANSPPPRLFFVKGNSGSGKTLHLKHLSRHLKCPLLLVDVAEALQSEMEFQATLRRVVREAIIQQALLGFQHVQVLFERDDAVSKRQQLLRALDVFSFAFMLSEEEWPDGQESRRFLRIDLQIPPDQVRKRLWEQFRDKYPIKGDVNWQALASQFRFTIGQIQQALETAEQASRWQHSPNGEISPDMLYQACYAQVEHQLAQRAVRLQPRYLLDDLILPHTQREQLRNVINQVKYRGIVYDKWGFERKLPYGKGLSVLLCGPPGTGKTMAAEVIAHELQLEIYKIDLSQMISKYIGETEKNLHVLFEEAKLSSAILFFDEADALFGKRTTVSSAHDKFANVETSYLLQKIEEYEGITILATNFEQNIDEAFLRRIQHVIRVPFPDASHREQIWRGMFPRETPLANGIDFARIAEHFRLSGGHIKNAALTAAFRAAEANSVIDMQLVLRAIRMELQKMGKTETPEEARVFAEYLRE